jgi:branched-chain amino acid transport system ATP-binding protein
MTGQQPTLEVTNPRGVSLEVGRLEVDFEGLIAVSDLSFSVRPGEMFGVIGPNGAGKTTVLNAISGLLRPQAGTVLLEGQSILGFRPHRIAALGVARTFQAAEVFNEFRVEDYLLLGRIACQNKSIAAAALHLPGARRSDNGERKEAVEFLAKYEVEGIAGETLKNLPYGVRKLVDLLRALFAGPRLLMLDEPTSGTASNDRRVLRSVLQDASFLGITTILVDHDVRFVSDLCNRVLAMNFGQELGTGTPEEVLSRPDVQASYVGLDVAEA